GASGIAIGNIIGSNMTQITLILGAAALFRSLDTTKKALYRDGLMMLVASTLALIVLLDYRLTNVEGMVLATIYLVYLFMLFKTEKWAGERQSAENLHIKIGALILGIAGVIVGADLLVKHSIAVADYFKVPSSIIGLTLVAVGTSLPELSISLMAAVKGLPGLSIGNLIGSNITDPLFSMGIAASVNPMGLAVDPWIVRFDAPVMIGACILALFLMRTDWNLSRREGVLLMGIYLLYLYVNFIIKI
ncbi:MAG: sodium:calcium antiporter, partial [Candidatus Hydrothermarchaeales archaeon]